MKKGSKKDVPENRDLRKTKLTLSISAMLHEWIENNVEEADV